MTGQPTARLAYTANAAPAPADYPLIQEFGTEEVLVDGAGTIIQGWTIDNLEPSMDIIGWPVRGRLCEADATVRAIRGTATPIVSNFNAVRATVTPTNTSGPPSPPRGSIPRR